MATFGSFSEWLFPTPEQTLACRPQSFFGAALLSWM